MDCREASGMAKDFIEDGLRPADVRKYLKHIDGCDACRSETETLFLLDRVRKSLDQDPKTAEYDFKGAFEKEVSSKKRMLQMIAVLRGITVLLALAAAGVIVWLIFFSGYFK